MFISDGGGIRNWPKNLHNHQYGQNFIFCFQVQPEISKRGILFIGSPGSFTYSVLHFYSPLSFRSILPIPLDPPQWFVITF